jgi:hypothetical protein
VIGADGTITGGSYVTSIDVANQCSGGSFVNQHSTAFDSATGAVAPTGQGQVQWKGTETITATQFDCSVRTVTRDAGTPIMQFWITGDDMVLCRGLVTSPTTCNFDVTATFHREG